MDERQSVTKLMHELDAALSKTDSLSERDRQLLEHLRGDIQELLVRLEKSAIETDEAVFDRLKTATRRFEVTHPSLTEAMTRVINSLSNLGI